MPGMQRLLPPIACSHNPPISLDKVTDQWNLRAYSHNLAIWLDSR